MKPEKIVSSHNEADVDSNTFYTPAKNQVSNTHVHGQRSKSQKRVGANESII